MLSPGRGTADAGSDRLEGATEPAAGQVARRGALAGLLDPGVAVSVPADEADLVGADVVEEGGAVGREDDLGRAAGAGARPGEGPQALDDPAHPPGIEAALGLLDQEDRR